jgi:hypothetical protein
MEAILAAKSITPTLLLLGGLIVTVVAMGLVVVWVRGRMLAKEGMQNQTGLLESLRAMRDRGEISIEEYDAARLGMAAKMAGKPRPAPATGSRPMSPGVKVARPGFDLTGAPLPQASSPPTRDQ